MYVCTLIVSFVELVAACDSKGRFILSVQTQVGSDQLGSDKNDVVFISSVHVRQRQAANVNRLRSKMFSHLSLKDLCCIALLLDEEEEDKKRKRRFGTHKMLKIRKISGEYWTLFRQLMDILFIIVTIIFIFLIKQKSIMPH